MKIRKIIKYILLISIFLFSCTKPIISNPNYYLLVNKSFTSTKIELSQDNINWQDATLAFYPITISFNNPSSVYNGGLFIEVAKEDNTNKLIAEQSGYWSVLNSQLILNKDIYNILFLTTGQIVYTSINKLLVPNGEYWYYRFTIQ